MPPLRWVHLLADPFQKKAENERQATIGLPLSLQPCATETRVPLTSVQYTHRTSRYPVVSRASRRYGFRSCLQYRGKWDMEVRC